MVWLESERENIFCAGSTSKGSGQSSERRDKLLRGEFLRQAGAEFTGYKSGSISIYVTAIASHGIMTR